MNFFRWLQLGIYAYFAIKTEEKRIKKELTKVLSESERINCEAERSIRETDKFLKSMKPMSRTNDVENAISDYIEYKVKLKEENPELNDWIDKNT